MTAAGRSAGYAALGTTALVVVDEPEALGGAEAIPPGELDGIDRACSRFREDSELSHATGDAPGARLVHVAGWPEPIR